MRDPRYDILFEPVKIGPVKAPNRFYQVPHCTGMGFRYPKSEARHRGVKAEGGWGVVSTQEVEIHPTSDLTPANEGRLWDDGDMPGLRLMADAVHAYGSLAAIELVHNGLHVGNRYSRLTPLAPSHAAVDTGDPVQARAMDKADIAAFRQWHVAAARRAREIGFDIIYVYAGHDMTLLQHFLLARHNHRTDAYGGSLENRVRLFREVIQDTKEAVGDRCAVAVRLAVDELFGPEGLEHDGEARDIVAALAEEPDLWDVNLSGWENDSQTSRFAKEGFQEPYIRFVKSLTSKPVVGVGRYTSPDAMVRAVASGVMDMVGAARPSIADPFLPKKIEAGRMEDIRECIGCNICVSGDNTMVPMRCTQNPTVGEEWRRDWHPEVVPSIKTPERYLVVGGGPAGLEAATTLAARDAEVTLAERRGEWGGRVALESRLPGLAEWGRVRDWRLWRLRQRDNAALYLESQLTADDVLGYGVENVALATGARWRADGVGRVHRRPLPFLDPARVRTPDDLMADGPEAIPSDGPVVIFDDDGFYLGGVLAELAAVAGRETIYVTPDAIVSAWSERTLEQRRIQTRLIECGVEIIPLHKLADMGAETLTLVCIYSGAERMIPCHTLVPVTTRLPNDGLWRDLEARKDEWADAGLKSVVCIGDALAPGLIAAAVYSGGLYARTAASGDMDKARREDNRG